MRRALNILTTVLAILVSHSYNYAQPVVDSVKIIPTNPTTQDSIYVITSVTTATQGIYLGNEVVHAGNTITVNICIVEGILQEVTNYIDTFNIGLKSTGNYNVNVKAYFTSQVDSCVPIDSSNTTASFTVGPVGLNELTSSFKQVVRVVDSMGRETEDKPNTLIIYIYSDGTTKKVFRVE